MKQIRKTFHSYDELKKYYNNISQEKYVVRPMSHEGKCHESRWSWALDMLNKYPSRTVLDIGCWVGDLPIILNYHGYETECIEPVVLVYEEAKKVFKERDYDIKISNCMLEDFETDKRYDAIISFEVIEHVYDMDVFLKKIKKYLKPGGIYILTTPSEHGLFGFRDFNFLHLWTASEESIKETFKDWTILELDEKFELYHVVVKNEV